MDRESICIGASSISRPIGLSRWETPLRFYARTLGYDVDDDETEAVRIGKFLEPAIAAAFADEFGVVLHQGVSLFHPDWAWLRATPDYWFGHDDAPEWLRRQLGLLPGERVLVEIKTAGLASFLSRGVVEEWGEAGTDAIPVDYAAQVQAQIATCDAAWRDLGVGFCNRAFVKPLIGYRGWPNFVVVGERDTFAGIRTRVSDFIEDHLVPEIPPPAAHDEHLRHSQRVGDLDLLEQIIVKRRTGKDVRLTAGEEEARAILRWATAKQQAEDADLAAKRARVELISMMGRDYGWRLEDGREVLHTIGTEGEAVSKVNAFDEVCDLIINDTSPLAMAIRGVVKRNTKTQHRGRSLRKGKGWPDKKDAAKK